MVILLQIMSLTIHELLDASLIGSDDSEIAELDAIELNQIGDCVRCERQRALV